MLIHGILNPRINSLLSRVRHTNTLVIADRGFPFWPKIETIDITLVDNIPTVLDVLRALEPNFNYGRLWMATEFLANDPLVVRRFAEAMNNRPIEYESHAALKLRVPTSIGLIRTADTLQYANIILESE